MACMRFPQGVKGEYFFMYACVISHIGARIPFNIFVSDIYKLVNVSPSQLHPNSCEVCFVHLFLFLFMYLFSIILVIILCWENIPFISVKKESLLGWGETKESQGKGHNENSVPYGMMIHVPNKRKLESKIKVIQATLISTTRPSPSNKIRSSLKAKKYKVDLGKVHIYSGGYIYIYLERGLP